MNSRNHSPRLRIGTWNTDWAKLGRVRRTVQGEHIREALAGPDCDVLCVTEGFTDILPNERNTIDGGSDWGYNYSVTSVQHGGSKVLLWSKQPWRDVKCTVSEELPRGRSVAGITETPAGPLTVVGVCIPWEFDHVRYGRGDAKKWQEHKAWLAAFERLPYRHAAGKTIVLGDFNQRIPQQRKETPYAELARAFTGLEFATCGRLKGAPELGCSHITHTTDLIRLEEVGIWHQLGSQEKPMPDHFGVWADFAIR